MSKQRFTIGIDGYHQADIDELMPDEITDLTHVLGINQPTLNEFLFEWNYSSIITATVIDNDTGETWTREGDVGKWKQIVPPAKAEKPEQQDLLNDRIKELEAEREMLANKLLALAQDDLSRIALGERRRELTQNAIDVALGVIATPDQSDDDE